MSMTESHRGHADPHPQRELDQDAAPLRQRRHASSKIKRGIADVLKKSGYIRDFRFIEDESQGTIKPIYLKYGLGTGSS